jgi:hypothetical protein
VASRATPPRLAPNLAGKRTGFTNLQPGTVPVGAYSDQAIVEVIPGGYAAGAVPASGKVTLTCGPMGLGTVWYPSMVAISTTTGALDTSTCAIYLSPLTDGNAQVPSTQIGGQSFAGGGSSVGLAGTPMYPGYFIVAVWTGATSGDQATLTVYGQTKVIV